MSQPQSAKLYKAGLKVVKLLTREGWQAFFVGGFVRNNLLKLTSDDIDIATDATPEAVEKILDKAKITNKPVGKKFGSILAIVDGFKIEITTFRSESSSKDKRHPDEVEFIKEYLDDAKRRDFTINALYFDPVKKQTFDPTTGSKDLKRKVLRFVGDPNKRIQEDALRMLRGVRFATQLGFNLEKKSFDAIKKHAKLIVGVSSERIKSEFDKILTSENRVDGVKLLDKTNLLKFIIPEMGELKQFTHKSKLYHLEGNMFNHTMLALEYLKNPELDLAYAVLFHDIGKPQVGQSVRKPEGWVVSTQGHENAGADIFIKFAKKYKFSSKNTTTIEWLIRNHMLQSNFTQMRSEKQINLAMNPNFDLLLEHWRVDHFGTKKAPGFDDHTKNFLLSRSYGKKILKRVSETAALRDKLANGEIIMSYSRLKPGVDLGIKIHEVKIQIVLGKIKNETDLKNFLK